MIFRKLFLLFLLAPLCVSAYENPIIKGFYPDPSICRVGNDYYLVNSTFEYFPAVPIFHSKDLVNWQQIGNVLDRPSQVKLDKCGPSGGIFAPTIRFHDGIFYMTTTNVSGGGNFFVTAVDPCGPWSEPIWVKQSGIDPSIHFLDGKVYFLTSYWGRSIQLSEIDPKNGAFIEKPRLIWNGTGGRYPEGPHLYKKDDYYYLLIAEGGTETGHAVTMARSRSPWGPYDPNPANPVLTHNNSAQQANPIQGTGHADLVQAPDESWWAVCLGFRMHKRHHNMGRETFLVPVSWEKNAWPVFNGDGSIQKTIDVPTLPMNQVESTSATVDFDEDHLPLNWNYLRNPVRSNYSLSERKGYLCLNGSAISLDQQDSPTFVGRRQQNMNFTFTSLLEPQSASNGQVGITVYMNPLHHYDLYATDKEIVLRCRLGLIDYAVKRIPLKKRSVQFQIVGVPEQYAFAYSYDGKEFFPVGTLDTRYLSTQTAGGFTGVFLGIYAYGKGSTGYFDWVKYKGLD